MESIGIMDETEITASELDEQETQSDDALEDWTAGEERPVEVEKEAEDEEPNLVKFFWMDFQCGPLLDREGEVRIAREIDKRRREIGRVLRSHGPLIRKIGRASCRERV